MRAAVTRCQRNGAVEFSVGSLPVSDFAKPSPEAI
jgi:hypothetical protein